MWTLNADVNQAGGRKLEQLEVKDPDGKTVKMSKLKKTAKKNIEGGKEMWIKIKSTK